LTVSPFLIFMKLPSKSTVPTRERGPRGVVRGSEAEEKNVVGCS
jgi:hypothetical protein